MSTLVGNAFAKHLRRRYELIALFSWNGLKFPCFLGFCHWFSYWSTDYKSAYIVINVAFCVWSSWISKQSDSIGHYCSVKRNELLCTNYFGRNIIKNITLYINFSTFTPVSLVLKVNVFVVSVSNRQLKYVLINTWLLNYL